MTVHLHPPESRIPLVLLDEFLVAEEYHGLMDYTWERSADFDATRVVGSDGAHRVDPGYRRSRVLFDLARFRDIFAERITTFLPQVFAGLDHPGFAIADFEIQLTATGDGEFFHRHNDNGVGELGSRRISFVYFFYRQPRPFTGGELCIFDTELRDGDYCAPGPYAVITPYPNQICFFISDYIHEVLPVVSNSADFMNSRFTVNGWLHA